MNKHLNDLTKYVSRLILESSRPFSGSTESKHVKVQLPLMLELQKLLENTPIAEVDPEVMEYVQHALEREF